MNIKVLNRLCYTVCIICIVAGTVLTFTMIWGTYENTNPFVWKA